MGIVWLEAREIIHFQNELVSEHGGLPGLPDEGALESTLARPQQLLAYETARTMFDLAASYGYGFARNHCFPDGNKRVALASIDVFLMLNGHELTAPEAEAVITMNALADGRMSENDLSAWIESNATALRQEM